MIEQWRQQYNRIRTHAALGYRPPAGNRFHNPRLGCKLSHCRWYKISAPSRVSEIQLLREHGTTVVTPEGEHFLTLDAPPEAVPESV